MAHTPSGIVGGSLEGFANGNGTIESGITPRGGIGRGKADPAEANGEDRGNRN